TFCCALHMAGLSYNNYTRVNSEGGDATHVAEIMGVSLEALQQIRWAVAETRTWYQNGTLSQAQVLQNIHPDAKGRTAGAKLTQDLVWYREWLDNNLFFKRPSVNFSANEQSYYYGTGFGVIGLNDSLDVTVVYPSSMAVNDAGYVGPFNIQYSAGSAASLRLINNNGPSNNIYPTYTATTDWDNVIESKGDGTGSRLNEIPMYTPFYVKAANVSGEQNVLLTPSQDIITGILYESIFFDGEKQIQYGLEFTYAGKTGFSFWNETEPIGGLDKKVAVTDGDPETVIGEGAYDIYQEIIPNDYALFRMTVSNYQELPTDYLLMSGPDTGTIRRIYTASQLASMGNVLNNGVTDTTFRLMNNIDMTEYFKENVAWPQITLGTRSVFDGQGYTIAGFNPTTTGNNLGLFATNNGTVRNLVMTDSVITGKTSGYVSGSRVGAIAASNNNIIENVVLDNVTVYGANYVGGVTGYNEGTTTTTGVLRNLTLANVKVYGGVIDDGEFAGAHAGSYLGGIAGRTRGTMQNTVLKNVTVGGGTLPSDAEVEGSYFGGIAGTSLYRGNAATDRDAIWECRLNGVVVDGGKLDDDDALAGINIGGVVGSNTGVVRNIDAANVEARGRERVGGIAGLHVSDYSIMQDVHIHDSDIYAANMGGGMVGLNSERDFSSFMRYGRFTRCFVEDSTITGGSRLGGIVGSTSETSMSSECLTGNPINYCEVSNVEINATGTDIGGIVGWASIAGIANCKVDGFTINPILEDQIPVSTTRGYHYGGIGGFYQISNTGIRLLWNNNWVNDFNIDVDAYGYQPIIGGILGAVSNADYFNGTNANIYDCLVTNSSLKGNGLTGGILGGSINTTTVAYSGALRIATCDVLDTTLASNLRLNEDNPDNDLSLCEVLRYQSNAYSAMAGIAARIYCNGQGTAIIDGCHVDVEMLQYGAPLALTAGITPSDNYNGVNVYNCSTDGSIWQEEPATVSNQIVWGVGGYRVRWSLSEMDIDATTASISGVSSRGYYTVGSPSAYSSQSVLAANPRINTRYPTGTGAFRVLTAVASVTNTNIRAVADMKFTSHDATITVSAANNSLTSQYGLAVPRDDLQDPAQVETHYPGWDFDTVWNLPIAPSAPSADDGSFPTLKTIGLSDESIVGITPDSMDGNTMGASASVIGAPAMLVKTLRGDVESVWAYGAITRYVRDRYQAADAAARNITTKELLCDEFTSLDDILCPELCHDLDSPNYTTHAATGCPVLYTLEGLDEGASVVDADYFRFYHMVGPLTDAGVYTNTLMVDWDSTDAEIEIKREPIPFYLDINKGSVDDRVDLEGAEFTLYRYSGADWTGTRSMVTTLAPPLASPFLLPSRGYYEIAETHTPDGYVGDSHVYRFYLEANDLIIDELPEGGQGSFGMIVDDDAITLVFTSINMQTHETERGANIALGGTKTIAEVAQWLTLPGGVTFNFEMIQVARDGSFILTESGGSPVKDSPAIVYRTASRIGAGSFSFDEVKEFFDGDYYFLITETACSSTDPNWILDETTYFVKATIAKDSTSPTGFITSPIMQANYDELVWGEDDWTNFDEIATAYDQQGHSSLNFENRYHPKSITDAQVILTKSVLQSEEASVPADWSFDFDLYRWDSTSGMGASPVATATATSLETTTTLTLPAMDSPGHYCYVIREKGPSAGYEDPAWINDNHEYLVEVEVTYVSYLGILHVNDPMRVKSREIGSEVGWSDIAWSDYYDESIGFFNDYQEYDDLPTGSLVVSKLLTGTDTEASRDWTFTVTFSDGGTYDGVASGVAFTLKGEQSRTISGIPQGVVYGVAEAEADSDGYETTSTGASGTMSANGAVATFTNHRDKALGDLTVSKDLVGNHTEAARDWTFTVTFSDEGTYDGVASGVPFTLRGGQSKEICGIPQGVFYAVEEAEADSDGYLTTSTEASGTINSDLSHAVFTNTRYQSDDQTGILRVEKLLDGNDTEVGRDWHFTVIFSDEGTYDGVGSGVPFTLQGGQDRLITGIPAGVTYSVTEAEADIDGYITTSTGQSGEISSDLCEAIFTNTRNSEEVLRGTLKVSKALLGNNTDPTADFHFVIDFSDEGTYDGVASGVPFTLKGGQERTITGIPYQVSYAVLEVEADADGYMTTATGQVGIISATPCEAAFVNTRNRADTETGTLIVTKVLSGNNTEADREFSFTVSFSDGGTYDGVASGVPFNLRGGQSRTISGIPLGVSYIVDEVEANTDGYSTTATGVSGTISAE
ncbi:MAG: prealbumin-like fold domain-containing protein, partial [Actinomycetia bacterium]|nr:prealbumin-like fold domain-containing protein [Actinomycetes bacterium]